VIEIDDKGRKMEPFATAFVERLQELVKGFDSAIEGLSPDALDWTPGPEMNSISVLATHSAAAVRYLIGDVVGGDPSGRVREQEFRTRGVDGEQLRQRFADVVWHSEIVISKLTVADLGKENFSPQHDRTYSVAWCLFRALDHLSEHMAHAQLTRLLWEQQANES
jgi:hypothetical protein